MSNLRNYLGAIDDYLGDDDELGAVAPRMFRRGGLPAKARQAKRVLAQPMPGVPRPGPRLEPLGFPAFAFTAASGTAISQVTRPQKPFKGGRLVIDIARTGATATGLITVTSMLIGARPVLVNSNPIGAGAFAATAFGVELNLDEAPAALDITLVLATSVAPGGADKIDVAATLLGMTWS